MQTHISSRQTEKNLFLLLNYEEEGLNSCRLDNVDIFTVPRDNIYCTSCKDDERWRALQFLVINLEQIQLVLDQTAATLLIIAFWSL